jgi:hypothetical protein
MDAWWCPRSHLPTFNTEKNSVTTTMHHPHAPNIASSSSSSAASAASAAAVAFASACEHNNASSHPPVSRDQLIATTTTERTKAKPSRYYLLGSNICTFEYLQVGLRERNLLRQNLLH